MPTPDPPLLFRASAESWIGKFLLPFTFVGLALITGVNLTQVDPFWTGVGLLGLLFIAGTDYLIPMLLDWVRLDLSTIDGSQRGRRYKIYWSEVLAAWMVKQNGRPFLCLGTRAGTIILSLRFFQFERVWKEVSTRVSPEALKPDAVRRLPEYLEWSRKSKQLVNSPIATSQVIDHWVLQVTAWGTLIFFLTTSIGAWAAGQLQLLPLFLGLSLAALIWILNWGVTRVDADGLTRRTMTGTWHIRWEELRKVEMDLLETWLVLEGENKRLALTGPALWLGPAREEILTLLRAQAEVRRIPLRRSYFVLLKFSKNTRLKLK